MLKYFKVSWQTFYVTQMSNGNVTFRRKGGGKCVYRDLVGETGQKTHRTRAALFHNGQTRTGKSADVFQTEREGREFSSI